MYSDIKKGAFCERCVSFGKQQSDRNGMKMRKLFVEPFVDWKHARKRFQKHENDSSIHSVANEQYLRFKDNYVANKSTPVYTQLNDVIKIKWLENRMKLSSIICCVFFCGKQNIALRGHRDDAKYLRIGGNNAGNFQELLTLMEQSREAVLKRHLAHAPRNATYRSQTIQNQIINIAADFIRKEILTKKSNKQKPFLF